MIAFALVLTPWLIRNYLVFGEFALTSNGGINLMIGNNAASTGAYKYAFDPLLFHDSKNEFDVDHKALRYAARYIVSNPGTSVLNAAKKTARLFESEGALLVQKTQPQVTGQNMLLFLCFGFYWQISRISFW